MIFLATPASQFVYAKLNLTFNGNAVSSPVKQRRGKNLAGRFLRLPVAGVLTEHLIKPLLQLLALRRLLLRGEDGRDVFQPDFRSVTRPVFRPW